MRLFLCDDNPDYRTLARLVLEKAGYEIAGEAADGQEAIEHAPRAAPDVVLLDLTMPRLDGFGALPHLRELLPASKILILTTAQAPDEYRRALDAGADGFIVKPDRVFTLPERLDAALGREG
jgi:two-component system chemotaxis response regulator CheY